MKVLDKGNVELIDFIGDEKRIVEVARISYGKEDETDEQTVDRILDILLNNGHYSPFEHVSFTFKVKAPIFVARQWLRHRTGSYNEQSRRYTKNDWEYYIPELNLLPNSKIDNKHIQKRIDSIMKLEIREYEELLNYGVKPEIARSIMGTGFYTTFYFSMDLRNLLHFLELRTEEHAQKEIQEYANAIELLVDEKLPIFMKKWRKKNGN